jgi:holin-like protein
MQKPPDRGVRLTSILPSLVNTRNAANVQNKLVQRLCIELPFGFIVLLLSLLSGEGIKVWLHLPIPGNVLGLFVLLLCFRARLIPPELVEEASNRLLFVLPALFIPIYVSAIGHGQLWSKMSWVLLPTLLAATASLWIFVGHLAQNLLRRSFQDE